MKYSSAPDSSPTSPSTDAASLYQSASDYYTFAATALLVWHYLLTLDKEVAFFWARRGSGARILFFANRYLSLVRAVYAVSPWNTSALSEGQCTAKAFTFLIIEVVQYALWASFSALRAYALRRTWVWAALILCLSFIPTLASAAVMLRWEGFSVRPGSRCTIALHSRTSRSEWIVVMSTRVGLIMGEIMVVAITWMATAAASRSQDILKATGRSKTLSRVMYENGTFYFAASTTLNVLVLVFYVITCTSLLSPDSPITLFANFVETIYDALAVILTTHFLMNLQEAACASTRVSSHFSSAWESQGPLSVLQFARADVDNLTQDFIPWTSRGGGDDEPELRASVFFESQRGSSRFENERLEA